MKITQKRLKEIIKEEISALLAEGEYEGDDEYADFFRKVDPEGRYADALKGSLRKSRAEDEYDRFMDMTPIEQMQWRLKDVEEQIADIDKREKWYRRIPGFDRQHMPGLHAKLERQRSSIEREIKWYKKYGEPMHGSSPGGLDHLRDLDSLRGWAARKSRTGWKWPKDEE